MFFGLYFIFLFFILFFFAFSPVFFVVHFPSMLSQLGDAVVEPGVAMPPVAMVGDTPHLDSGSAMCGCKFKSYRVVCYKHTRKRCFCVSGTHSNRCVFTSIAFYYNAGALNTSQRFYDQRLGDSILLSSSDFSTGKRLSAWYGSRS